MNYLDMLTQQSEAQSLGQRVNEAYQRTRTVAGLWHAVDARWRLFNVKLGHLKNPSASSGAKVDNSDAIKQLCEGMLADLNRWAANPQELLAPPPPPPPDPPHIVARTIIADMRRIGVVLTADFDGRLSAYPASKLPEQEKSRLKRFKDALVEEINREVFLIP